VINSRSESKIPVMESFYSIQGEGTHTGKPSYFIRLAGCDVNCHWCDVKDSWDIHENQYKTVKEIVNDVLKSPAETIIITGGEPLMHDLSDLTYALKEKNKKIHLETSGTHPISGTFDWICFSPKKFKKPLDNFFEISDELKIIIFNDSDFKWAEDILKKIKNNPELIFQPEWSRSEKNNSKILEYIKENPSWRISLQTHKYLGVE
jgi:organic radical activating enzyme|tara:strand:- start:998 stop:1615 length:618 start_codon:yes stop_codon:yes gene_type:complete